MHLERLKLLGPCFPFVPRLEGDKIGGVVTGTDETEQTKPDEAGAVLDARRLHDDLFLLFRNRSRAFEGGAIGQLHVNVGVTLIFVREKTGWHAVGKKPCRHAKNNEQNHDYGAFAEQHTAPTNISVGGPVKDPVEPIEESAQQPMAFFFRPKQQRSQRGAERKSIEGREKDGNGNSDGKLLIESAGDSWNEGRWNEDSGKNQGDADHGAGEFFHGFQRRVLRRHALFDMTFHAFDHDDRVVDDKADCQYQAKQRKRIDGKTEQRKKYERADQRNGHGKKRDQRGTPALKEDIDN